VRICPWQLGDGGCSRQPCPSPVLAKMPPAPVVQLACGEEFSCAVTADGRLLTWGFGGCGQLGHGSALSLKVGPRAAP
jgi:alpha-tubulin suppressor-like RCC1 family protein